jgi:hypothetical protein
VSNPNGTPKNLLAPWKKGQSGNPLGRPKGRVSLSKILAERLKDRHFFGQPTPDDRLVAEWLVDAMLTHAIKDGNANLFQQIFDRNDGKLAEPEKNVNVTMDVLGILEGIVGDTDSKEGSPSDPGMPGPAEPIQ